jgi:hypothetical protein
MEHKETAIEKVKKGDYFRLKVNGPVYVADGYNRSTRKYSAFKFDDINAFVERKKGVIVFTGFDF